MSENAGADVFRRRRRRGSRQRLEIFLRLLEALDLEADVIEALAHADIRAVIRRQYEQANFTVAEADGIAQRRLLDFEELENVLVEAGDLSRLGGANRQRD